MEWREIIASPFWEVTNLASRAFVLYFLSYAALAYGIYRYRGAQGTFRAFLFPPGIYAQREFFFDAVYFCLITAFSFICGAALAAVLLPEYRPLQSTSITGYALDCIAGVLLFDALMFAVHWCQHKSAFLWRFHALHHEPEQLNVLVAFRHHPVDIALITIVLTATTAILPQPEVNVFIMLFYVAGYHFRHSHIPLRYPAWLSYILVSPSDHQMHHDRRAGKDARNLGFIFSFWDRLAGTYKAG